MYRFCLALSNMETTDMYQSVSFSNQRARSRTLIDGKCAAILSHRDREKLDELAVDILQMYAI